MELPAFLRRTKPEVKEPILKAPMYHSNTDTYHDPDTGKVIDTDTNRVISERMADHMRIRNQQKGRREILGTESAVTKRTLLGIPVPSIPEHPVKQDEEDTSAIATGVAIGEIIADLSDLGSSDSGSDTSIDDGGGDFGGGGSDASW